MRKHRTNVWQRFWQNLTSCSRTELTTPDNVVVDPAPISPNAAAEHVSPARPPRTLSAARTDDEYRRDCARHIYERYAHQIYLGTLPSMLYAIGSLQLNLDAQGQIITLYWMREPSHAPEVTQKIEDMVYAIAPFPARSHVPQSIYIDTWLWDKSDRFQLHTLTEGQR